LAVLEAVGHKLGFMNGTRTRGRKPDRLAEVYLKLQELLRVRFKTIDLFEGFSNFHRTKTA
jgi:hypothetical protein